jgi:integrator complex subunit 9
VLLECPLDLSVLAIFLPSFQSVQDGATPVSSSSLRFISHVLASKSEQELASSRPTAAAAAAARTVEQEKTLKDSINNLSTVKSEPLSARAKRPRSEQQSQGPGSATEGKQKRKSHTDVMSASLSFLKENSGQVLIEGEPWYKTAELGLVEVALLDAVVVSNPLGLLGLPFLTKNPDFSAKVNSQYS